SQLQLQFYLKENSQLTKHYHKILAHLTAWIRFKGKIDVASTWSWKLKAIKIGELEGQHFSVQKALK
ncbi:32282_t:CDS:1, partial [Gigaspora margarita]